MTQPIECKSTMETPKIEEDKASESNTTKKSTIASPSEAASPSSCSSAPSDLPIMTPSASVLPNKKPSNLQVSNSPASDNETPSVSSTSESTEAPSSTPSLSPSNFSTQQTIASSSAATCFLREFKPLANNFAPGPCDVICARGKAPFSHAGNIKFRQIITDHLDAYSNTATRVAKSNIVTKIVDMVRKSSPLGGFVKHYDGKWYEVGDRIAREKVGQGFRDILHTKYISSHKCKKRRRTDEEIKFAIQIEEFLQTHCKNVINKLKLISKSTKDKSISELQDQFNQTQIELLEIMKGMKMPTMKTQEKVPDTVVSKNVTATSSSSSAATAEKTEKIQSKKTKRSGNGNNNELENPKKKQRINQNNIIEKYVHQDRCKDTTIPSKHIPVHVVSRQGKRLFNDNTQKMHRHIGSVAAQ